ncbi:MAG TPA: DUF2298 domain-containing protein [Chloroflexota bacterium]
MLMILAWLAVLEGLSLLAWPLARLALPGAVDRGWAASRTLALMLLSLALCGAATLHLIPLATTTIALLAVLGGGLVWLACRPWSSRARLPREALIGEALFLATFALALGLRAVFPSVDNNERPMDFAFLNAFVRADALPAPDPWFAGQPIAYYTLGYLSWASVTRLSGVPVEVAYNLAVASVFASTVALVWATAASWRWRLADGFLATATFALVGNLRTLIDFLISVGAATQDWWAGWATSVALDAPDPGWIFWLQASRVIPNSTPEGITEFPFFSLIVGDLHPHYMAMALNILAVSLTLAACRGGPLPVLIPLGSAVLAALAATNTWNVPAAAAILGLGLASRFCWPRPRPALGVATLGLLLLGAAALAAPALSTFSPPPLTLAWTPRAARLWPGTFVVLFLPYILALAAVLAASAAAWRGWPLALVAWATAAAIAEVFTGAGVALVVAGAGLGLCALAVRAATGGDSVRAGLLATCAVAAGLVLAPEVVFLNDFFGSRMNTVFKNYFQALLFLAVALPPLFAAALPRPAAGSRRSALLVGLRRGAIYAGLASMLYVPLAPVTRMAASPSGGTLDALAFLNASAPDDLAIVNWLRSVPPRDSVILEAVDRHEPIGIWRTDVARLSAFSGQPTLIGWTEHEQQWRGRLPAIDQRLEAVETVFESGSPQDIQRILDQYRVAFVVVGRSEHLRYGQDVDERFRGWLEPEFQSGDSTVYRVPERLVAAAAR